MEHGRHDLARGPSSCDRRPSPAFSLSWNPSSMPAHASASRLARRLRLGAHGVTRRRRRLARGTSATSPARASSSRPCGTSGNVHAEEQVERVAHRVKLEVLGQPARKLDAVERERRPSAFASFERSPASSLRSASSFACDAQRHDRVDLVVVRACPARASDRASRGRRRGAPASSPSPPRRAPSSASRAPRAGGRRRASVFAVSSTFATTSAAAFCSMARSCS